jgi:spoIIIJ-associated protein
MESLEISARTVEEAIQIALDQLGVSRDQVEISVVKEGKAGILGIGSDEAVVRVTPLDGTSGNEEEADKVAMSVLGQLLDLMEIDSSMELLEQPLLPQDQAPVEEDDEEAGSPVVINISGGDLGILIGRRGQTLSCLQYITRLIVGHQTRKWLPITIDVEGYKKRRYQALQDFAKQMAEQVAANEKSFTMEPMPAYERRIVHLTLADNPDVVTESIGQGEARRVVILPKEYSD